VSFQLFSTAFLKAFTKSLDTTALGDTFTKGVRPDLCPTVLLGDFPAVLASAGIGGVVTSEFEELPHWQVVHLLEDSVGLQHVSPLPAICKRW
jgi:hypothetical protein